MQTNLAFGKRVGKKRKVGMAKVKNEYAYRNGACLPVAMLRVQSYLGMWVLATMCLFTCLFEILVGSIGLH